MACAGWLTGLRTRFGVRSGTHRDGGRRWVPGFDAVESRVLLAGAGHVAAIHPTSGGAVVHTLATGRAASHAVLTPQVVAALNAEIHRQIRSNNLPGAVVEITVPGEHPFIAAQGTSNLLGTRPRNATDSFRIASITKTFTATAVLELIDRGVLHKTDTMAEWFPTFPNAANITIDDLLRMRSGIPEVFDAATAAAFYANPTQHVSADQVIALAAAKAGQFQPADTATVYTDTNYTILGRIVELATGQSLGAEIQRTILKPLGLTHTYYATGTSLAGPVHGYSLDPGTNRLIDKTQLDPAIAGGAGAMVSTVGDLTKYVQALASGRLLTPTTQAARLVTAPIQGASGLIQYGEGIETMGQFIGQSGTIYGFSTEMYYLPALRATIVINVNRLDADNVSQSTPLFLSLSKIAFPRYVSW